MLENNVLSETTSEAGEHVYLRGGHKSAPKRVPFIGTALDPRIHVPQLSGDIVLGVCLGFGKRRPFQGRQLHGTERGVSPTVAPAPGPRCLSFLMVIVSDARHMRINHLTGTSPVLDSGCSGPGKRSASMCSQHARLWSGGVLCAWHAHSQTLSSSVEDHVHYIPPSCISLSRPAEWIHFLFCCQPPRRLSHDAGVSGAQT